MNELSGNPAGNGDMPPQRIEAGPGMYDQGDSYGGGDRDLKPWQRQPTGGAAPWQRDRNDRGGRDDYGARDTGGSSARPWAAGNRENDSYGGYGGAPGGGAAPWQQQQPPPPPPGGQTGYGYGGHPGSSYDQGYGAPPPAAPPGLSSFMHQYGVAPPPPPGDAPPPPPPSGDAPPPPPSDYPPPPPAS
jgi:splicing factor 1